MSIHQRRYLDDGLERKQHQKAWPKLCCAATIKYVCESCVTLMFMHRWISEHPTDTRPNLLLWCSQTHGGKYQEIGIVTRCPVCQDDVFRSKCGCKEYLSHRYYPPFNKCGDKNYSLFRSCLLKPTTRGLNYTHRYDNGILLFTSQWILYDIIRSSMYKMHVKPPKENVLSSIRLKPFLGINLVGGCAKTNI